jgi:hypothetical protein
VTIVEDERMAQLLRLAVQNVIRGEDVKEALVDGKGAVEVLH